MPRTRLQSHDFVSTVSMVVAEEKERRLEVTSLCVDRTEFCSYIRMAIKSKLNNQAVPESLVEDICDFILAQTAGFVASSSKVFNKTFTAILDSYGKPVLVWM